MKQIISEILIKSLKKEKIKKTQIEILSLIEIPPSQEMGDYAFPCFSLSKELKKSPSKIALTLRTNIKNIPKEFEDIQTSGPYLNFYLNKKLIAKKIIPEIISKQEDFGKISVEKPKKTMVEFPSPNTNKPLHLGHLRNMSIGESVSRILEFSGEKVIRANLNNDRGIHICKSMTAYEKFGKDKKPGRKKSDHFVGDFYVLYNKKLNDKLKSRAQEILQLWEKGDKKIHALWKKMNNWALEGFKETYDKFGIHHDIEFFESNLYKKGKNIVEKGLKNGIFEKTKDGAIKINLEKEKLGEKVLMRKDGTSVYMTQDLYLAKLKFEKYKIDKSIYVVGNEQNYHFNVLFSILRKLGFKKQMYHLSYGMVELPEGKMKSREGNVVDADNLIKDVQKLVKKELNKREKLSKKELEKRSLIISLASIKYMLLKTDIKKNMLFNPKESVSFEGNAGPYLLYTYARSCSILKKAKNYSSNIKIKNLEKQENKLLTKLNNFTDIFSKAKENLNPFLIANYSYELCKTFNEFYHSCPVIDSEKKDFRLSLVKCFKIILKNSLNLLGIDVLYKM